MALLAAASMAAAPGSLAQTADSTKPPPILASAGGARATERARLPALDGRPWVAANVHHLSDGEVAVPTRAFSLTFAGCGDHGGDFVRCQLWFQRGRSAPVRIDHQFTGWVFVTPDGRFVVTEPLYVLDVGNWRQYALSGALGIPNYTTVEAISREGSRLLVSQRDCAMDCPDTRVRYFEVTLPNANRR